MADLEARRRRSLEWYYRNRDKVLARRDKVKERVRQLAHYESVEGRARHMLNAAIARAKKDEVPVTITYEWVLERLSKLECEITGIPFDLKAGRGNDVRNPYAPSIDRIVPSLGYTQENCRLTIWMYNMSKCTWGDSDVLRMAEALCRMKSIPA